MNDQPNEPKYTLLKNVPIEDLPEFTMDQNPLFVEIKFRTPENNCEYTLGFCFEHPTGPYFRIETEKRRDFLKKTTEEEMQVQLETLANKIRAFTGGIFTIHAHFGLVWGTKSPTVNKDFLDSSEMLDDNLTIIVSLSNLDPLEYNEALTDKAEEIGPEIHSSDSNRAEEFFQYLQSLAGGNPNQSHRDTALINGNSLAFDQELIRHSSRKGIPEKAMVLTPRNIAELVHTLQRNLGFTEIIATRVNLES